MNLAVLTYLELASPLPGLVRWLAKALVPAPRRALASPPNNTAFAPEKIAHTSMNTGATAPFSLQKPLRVVRVLEAGQARTSVGRMVISGRMADVCAELDRLAAREAALT